MEKFGVSEIVDTLQDAMKMETDIIESASDGRYTVVEALTDGVQNYPRIAEAINDWPTFSKEIGDYSQEENNRLVELVGAGFSDEQKESSYVFGVITFATQGFDAFTVTRSKLDGLYSTFVSKVLKRSSQEA